MQFLFFNNKKEIKYVYCRTFDENLNYLDYKNIEKMSFCFKSEQIQLDLYKQTIFIDKIKIQAYKVATNNLDSFISFFYDHVTLQDWIYELTRSLELTKERYYNLSLFSSRNDELANVLDLVLLKNSLDVAIMFLKILILVFPFTINEFCVAKPEIIKIKILRYINIDHTIIFERITKNEIDKNKNHIAEEGQLNMNFKYKDNTEFKFWRNPVCYNSNYLVLYFGFSYIVSR
ncbi:hypothetical protein GVAV_000979 [Gurleya vavrai]